jgi:hypothetical protein
MDLERKVLALKNEAEAERTRLAIYINKTDRDIISINNRIIEMRNTVIKKVTEGRRWVGACQSHDVSVLPLLRAVAASTLTARAPGSKAMNTLAYTTWRIILVMCLENTVSQK